MSTKTNFFDIPEMITNENLNENINLPIHSSDLKNKHSEIKH
jgi:hypothetical protein